MITLTVTTDDLVSVANAAQQLEVARLTVYRWAKSGRIIAVTLGGTLYIPISEVTRLKEIAHATSRYGKGTSSEVRVETGNLG